MTVAYSNTSVGAPRDRLFAFVTRALKAKALVAGRTMCAFSETSSNHGGVWLPFDLAVVYKESMKGWGLCFSRSLSAAHKQEAQNVVGRCNR